MFTVIFVPPFGGVNFSRGIVKNPELGFKKDAAYDFLKNPKYNWRKFMLGLVVVRFFDVLTNEQRKKVLIFDDRTYDRSRSKVVELLAWIYEHNTGLSLKGFKLPTLGWSDGVSFLPLDFTLYSSAKASKRLQGIKKELGKRCCDYKRWLEVMVKSTDHLKVPVKRVLAKGVRANYHPDGQLVFFPLDLCYPWQGYAQGVLPTQRTMADTWPVVQQTENEARQGTDSCQCGC